MAAWVEDLEGRRVRLLALWFDRGEMKYVRDLNTFWKEAWVLQGGGSNPRQLRAWTRATRSPGRYTLTWNGLDDTGEAVPQGRYRLRLDVNRENGPHRERHTLASVELDCGASPARASAPDQPELGEVAARYGPRGE